MQHAIYAYYSAILHLPCLRWQHCHLSCSTVDSKRRGCTGGRRGGRRGRRGASLASPAEPESDMHVRVLPVRCRHRHHVHAGHSILQRSGSSKRRGHMHVQLAGQLFRSKSPVYHHHGGRLYPESMCCKEQFIGRWRAIFRQQHCASGVDYFHLSVRV